MKLWPRIQIFLTFYHITHIEILSKSDANFPVNEYNIQSVNHTNKEVIFGSIICHSHSSETQKNNNCCLLEFKNYGNFAIHVRI